MYNQFYLSILNTSYWELIVSRVRNSFKIMVKRIFLTNDWTFVPLLPKLGQNWSDYETKNKHSRVKKGTKVERLNNVFLVIKLINWGTCLTNYFNRNNNKYDMFSLHSFQREDQTNKTFTIHTASQQTDQPFTLTFFNPICNK